MCAAYEWKESGMCLVFGLRDEGGWVGVLEILGGWVSNPPPLYPLLGRRGGLGLLRRVCFHSPLGP